MSKKIIGVFVGSLRRESFSMKVASYLAGQLKEDFEVRFVDMASLALYNEDLDNENDMPEEWRIFRREVEALDAVLFVTPEYNRSVPAVLKNALDVASRPKSAGRWSGKPGAVVGVSPGNIGAFGACHHLRQTASCLDIYMMQQPETYVGGIAASVSADGVSSERTQEYLKVFAEAFSVWVNKFK